MTAVTTRPAAILSSTAPTYYRQVQDTLLAQLRGRAVYGSGRPMTGRRVALHISGVQDLEEAVRSGVVGFWLTGLDAPGLAGLRISPGKGAEIDTVATAVLSLALSMGRDGLASIALTDGAGGLYLFAWGVGEVAAGADAGAGYTAALTRSAPEMVTDNADDDYGRALIEVLAPARDGLPSPYSLITDPARHGEFGVVVPLTLDEVAAASAGMPLEIAPADVQARITAYGDLAAAWGQATRGSA